MFAIEQVLKCDMKNCACHTKLHFAYLGRVATRRGPCIQMHRPTNLKNRHKHKTYMCMSSIAHVLCCQMGCFRRVIIYRFVGRGQGLPRLDRDAIVGLTHQHPAYSIQLFLRDRTYFTCMFEHRFGVVSSPPTPLAAFWPRRDSRLAQKVTCSAGMFGDDDTSNQATKAGSGSEDENRLEGSKGMKRQSDQFAEIVEFGYKDEYTAAIRKMNTLQQFTL